MSGALAPVIRRLLGVAPLPKSVLRQGIHFVNRALEATRSATPSGRSFEVHNPAHGAVLAMVTDASASEARRAIDAGGRVHENNWTPHFFTVLRRRRVQSG